MEKKLVPYSVHLPESIYNRLKQAARDRKASSLVRDAIIMMVEGDTSFNAGYNKAIKDVVSLIKKHQIATTIGINGTALSSILISEITELRTAREAGHVKTKG